MNGGKGYSGGQEQDGLSRAQVIVIQLAHRSKALTKKQGEWFRRVAEAAEQYMKRWFVTEKEQAAKRRAL